MAKENVLETKEDLPKRCRDCLHQSFIPDKSKDYFYCWNLEGLCKDVLEYCIENNYYEPSSSKIEKTIFCNTWFFSKNYILKLIKKLDSLKELKEELKQYDKKVIFRGGNGVANEKEN